MKCWVRQRDIRRWRHEYGGGRRTSSGQLIDNLVLPVEYCVSTCGFTFFFHSLAEVEEYIAFFSEKNRGATRVAIGSADHWEMQSVFSRLPARLLTRGRRPRIAAALTAALAEFRRAGA